MTKSYMRGAISGYASLIESKDKKNAIERWPADVVAHYGTEIYQDMTCLGAWKVIPYNALVALIDTIKTRVLNFVLEIEEEAPDAGEAPPNTPPLPQEKVSQVFNTYITGNVQNVATGSSQVTQGGEFNIIQGDFASLESYLASLNIEKPDIEDLQNAIRADTETDRQPTFGVRVQSWIDKMVGKSASGAWKISTSVAGTMLSKALSKYFGLD